MQGNLNEIDIRSILQLIELGQRTGELFVEAYISGYTSSDRYGNNLSNRAKFFKVQSWFVFFLNGQIVYVADSDSSLARLHDYLRYYRLDDSLERIKVPSLTSINAIEYGYVWALVEHNLLTPAQARNIIQNIVQETLFDLLSLHQGSFIFKIGSPLAPQLTTLEIAPLVKKIIKQVQEWKQLYPYIQSPNQCPVIADSVQLRQALPEATVNNLERWADGKTSLRQLARYLNRDILTVAKAIYPVVQQNWVKLLEAIALPDATSKHDCGLWLESKISRIVYIDDNIAICASVEYVLRQQGYDAFGLNNSLDALSLIFQIKPDLILCDLAMPDLDSYELCAMLRRASAFRTTPIILLSHKDEFIEGVKARIVGATDYLTKPFADSELLTIIEKYIDRTK